MHSSTSLFIDSPLTNQEVGQRPYRGVGGEGGATISRLRNNFRDSEIKVFRTGILSHIWCWDYLPAWLPPNHRHCCRPSSQPSLPPLLYSHIWLTDGWVKDGTYQVPPAEGVRWRLSSRGSAWLLCVVLSWI